MPKLYKRPLVVYFANCGNLTNLIEQNKALVVTWERARKPEQIEERRKAILDAARNLFSELNYDDISLNAIAREARISKPNIYRYFGSREEIFLEIFKTEHARFTGKLVTRLKRVRAKDVVDGIARAWVDTAVEHSEFLDLLPQLSISMEENSSVDQLVLLKKSMWQNSSELVDQLCAVYPGLDRDDWNRVIHLAACMMTGLWPFTCPSDHVLEARQIVGEYEDWDFAVMMKTGFVSLVRGAVVGRKNTLRQ